MNNMRKIMYCLFGLTLTFFVLSFIDWNVNYDRKIHEFFYYFTLQTNLMVVLYFLFYDKELMKKFRTTIMVLITVTFLVYNILLRKDMVFANGFSYFSDLGIHVFNPLLMILGWYLTRNEVEENFRSNIYITAYGLGYCLVFMLVATYTSFNFPYFFIDYQKNGWPYVITYVIVLLTIFNLFTFLVVFISKKLKK